MIWQTKARVDRLDYLSTIAALDEHGDANPGNIDPVNIEFAPSNGLLVPNQLDASFHWLAQTQRMVNRGELKVRHIDYENAPFGRAVPTPSPYRWWLGAIAWSEHALTGAPTAPLVEKAGLLADPVLLALAISGFALLSLRRFGSTAGGLVALGLISFFPFNSGFFPGAPDDRGLAEICAIASVLFLAVAIATSSENNIVRRRWFILAGIAGGLGLWIKASLQLPVLCGIMGGGFFMLLFAPRPSSSKSLPPMAVLPWRAWAIAGAVTVCLASFIEYSLSYLQTLEISYVHPLQGLAWLGGGELLVRLSKAWQTRSFSRRPTNIVIVFLAAAAVVLVPVFLVRRHGANTFIIDGMGSSLSRFQSGMVAENFAKWMALQGPSIWLWLTLAPLSILIPTAVILTNPKVAQTTRAAIALTLGPLMMTLALACARLSWWQTVDAMMLVCLVVVVAGFSTPTFTARARLTWLGIILVGLVPGLIHFAADRPVQGNALNRSEIQGLILRDLAGWIRQHSEPGSVTVLAPPSVSTALCYYGGFRGIGSVSEDNKDGMVAAIRIMSAENIQEAQEVVNRRKISHIVLLSWDSFFDDAARAAAGKIEGTFRDHLKFTTLPSWLRPLAYAVPAIPGFEDQSATVLEVVDPQDEPTALSNIAMYFAEVGDLEQAKSASAGLSRFPIDFGAWVVRAQIAAATGDDAELEKAIKVLQSRLAARVPPLLSWNRRVDLTVVLARAKLEALAKKQLEICVAGADDAALRSLSPASVYRLLVLCRGLGVELPPSQREVALSLVPTELRARLK